jgi:hypothetical protein
MAGIFGALGMLAVGNADVAAMDITVVNTSTRDVDGLYLAATAQSPWGPDQIETDVLEQGASVTLRGVSCGQASIVVVAEDVAGCFLYQSVGCGGDATWTISNATPRDCGR